MDKKLKYKYNKKYRDNNKDKIKNSKLLTRYGITLDDFNKMLKSQDNKCAICLQKLKLGRSTHVDHCHSTNKVRGLLCVKCNLALGLLKDNVEALDRIYKYLKNT